MEFDEKLLIIFVILAVGYADLKNLMRISLTMLVVNILIRILDQFLPKTTLKKFK